MIGPVQICPNGALPTIRGFQRRTFSTRKIMGALRGPRSVAWVWESADA